MKDKKPYVPPRTMEMPAQPKMAAQVTPDKVRQEATREALQVKPGEIEAAQNLILQKGESAREDFVQADARKERVFDCVGSAVKCIKDSDGLADAKTKFFQGQKGKLGTGEVEAANQIFDEVYVNMQEMQHEGSESRPAPTATQTEAPGEMAPEGETPLAKAAAKMRGGMAEAQMGKGKVTLSAEPEGGFEKIGGDAFGEVYAGEAEMGGKMHKAAIKRFTKSPLTDREAGFYQQTIDDLKAAGVKMPEMRMEKLEVGTVIGGETLAQDEWVQVSELLGSAETGSELQAQSGLNIETEQGLRDAATELTKVANAGYHPAVDIIEQFRDSSRGVAAIDVDMPARRLGEEGRLKPEQGAERLVETLSIIGSSQKDREVLYEAAVDAASPELKEPLQKAIQERVAETGPPLDAVTFDQKVVGEACDGILDSPTTARDAFIQAHPEQERLFEAVDNAIDCAMGCDSMEAAREAFMGRMQAKAGESSLEQAFDAVYDKVVENQAAGIPADAVQLNWTTINDNMEKFLKISVKTAGDIAGKGVTKARQTAKAIAKVAARAAKKAKPKIDDVFHCVAGGPFTMSSKMLEEIRDKEIIPRIEHENFDVARRALQAEGGWDALEKKVHGALTGKMGEKEYAAMSPWDREDLIREGEIDELEKQGYHIRVKNPPAVRWASKSRMGRCLGAYNPNENLVEINRGSYFDVGFNPDKMSSLVGAVGSGTMGHEVYHSMQRTHQVGITRYEGQYTPAVFNFNDETPEHQQHLFNLWNTMLEGSAEFMTQEPHKIQHLLDVEEKILSKQPLTGNDEITAIGLLYDPYTFGQLTLANIRNQVTAHYVETGTHPNDARDIANQVVRDYTQKITPGMEKNMVEGLSIQEIAQMTNIRDAMYQDYVRAREAMGKPYLTAETIMEAVPRVEYAVLNNEVGLRQAELFHSQRVENHLSTKISEKTMMGEETKPLEGKLKEAAEKTKDTSNHLQQVWKQRMEYEKTHNILPTLALDGGDETIDLEFDSQGMEA